ncbi:cupredoxin domain-containing protein [Rhodococcus pseudokoreensis]|uniref:Cupredoxin domain-containing protein n=1 Tax=Rhodococcus pseudokoreensis TaxID=2811421 RepID=A0A974W0J0_9NOCA|nr:cupredoxin domain-containing protein [Rhodococcus pseudokoreensis]QSE88973.1 cupredoxin domain-containing protein [Rhodococcus pseudokoreensis]
MRVRGTSWIAGVALAASISMTAVVSGCSSPADEAPEAPTGPVVQVANMAYAPSTITVRAGDTVTWNFDDRGVTHDVVGVGAAKSVLRSRLMQTGTFTYTFTEPGTYEYTCSLHPDMTGTVVVTP